MPYPTVSPRPSFSGPSAWLPDLPLDQTPLRRTPVPSDEVVDPVAKGFGNPAGGPGHPAPCSADPVERLEDRGRPHQDSPVPRQEDEAVGASRPHLRGEEGDDPPPAERLEYQRPVPVGPGEEPDRRFTEAASPVEEESSGFQPDRKSVV